LPRYDPFVERFVKPCALFRQDAVPHSDARISQLHNAFAGMPRVYVNRADNNISDASSEYRVCAPAGAPFCGARFESNIQRRASRHACTETAQAFNFSVITACSSMMSFCHDSVADDENCANRGIGASLTERLLCLVEGRAHELFVSCSIHRFDT
jgi:hypothetical protein